MLYHIVLVSAIHQHESAIPHLRSYCWFVALLAQTLGPGLLVCACSVTQSCLALFYPMDLAHQVPLSMGFPRQEHWSGLLFPSPGDLPDPGIEPMSLASPALAGRFFIPQPSENPQVSLLKPILFPVSILDRFIILISIFNVNL